MAQQTYGSITITDLTDITNVFLQYGKANSSATVTNDYTFSGTGEVGWFTAATGTVDANTIYFQLINGVYKVVLNPSSTTGLYVSSPYPTWSSGFQIWIRQVTIKEGIDEPEYGTPYLDTAVNQINNTINIINYDLSNLTQRTGRFWTNEEVRRNGQTYDGVVWTKPDYLAGTYLAQGLSNFAYNDATTYGYNTFYGNGIVLRYNQYPLTIMNHEGIQINAPTLDNNNKINGSTKGTVIDSTGMEIFKYDATANNGNGADISVAKFGSSIRIGVENAAHINVTSGGLDLYNGATQASNLISHLGYDPLVNSGNTPYFTFGTRVSTASENVGEYSVVEGMENIASGMYSHAEGVRTIARADFSHTEGWNTVTAEPNNIDKFYGAYSHAEGYGSRTEGGMSHAEGFTTIASGNYSHSEGYETVANGNYSHASGDSTIADGEGQFVCGKFNISDITSMFILGNGTDDNNRSNLMMVGNDYVRIGNKTSTNFQITESGLYLKDKALSIFQIKTEELDSGPEVDIIRYQYQNKITGYTVRRDGNNQYFSPYVYKIIIDNGNLNINDIFTLELLWEGNLYVQDSGSSTYYKKTIIEQLHQHNFTYGQADSYSRTYDHQGHYYSVFGVTYDGDSLITITSKEDSHHPQYPTRPNYNYVIVSHYYSVKVSSNQQLSALPTTIIGPQELSHAEIDFNSFKMIDKDKETYLNIEDIRNINGQIIDTYSGTGYETEFKLSGLPKINASVIVTIDDVIQESNTYSFSRLNKIITFNTAPVYNSVIKVTYDSYGVFAFTFGSRGNWAGEDSIKGVNSFCIGENVIASGAHSFAQGDGTLAAGIASHAEGGTDSGDRWTIAYGDYSHAEGVNCRTEGYASHAQNQATIAIGDSQTTIGKYNIEDNNNTYALIIGNGTSNSTRSNALTVDWQGNLTLGSQNTSSVYLKAITTNCTAYTALQIYDAGDEYGQVVRLGAGGNVIVGAGESSTGLYSGNIDSVSGNGENLFLSADGNVYIYTNCNTIANRKKITIDTSGNIIGAANMFVNNTYGYFGRNTGGTNINLATVNSSNQLVFGNGGYTNSYTTYYEGGTITVLSKNNITLTVKDANTNVYTNGYLSSAGSYSNTTTYAANLYVASGGKISRSTASSCRYKTNIQSINATNLNPTLLYNIPIVQFKYKNEHLTESTDPRKDKLLPGFIAEDIAKIYPIAAEFSKDGQVEDWNFRYIIPPMLKLIQDQHKEIEQLKQEIQNIKNK